MVNITRVSYGRLVNLGNYENERIEATTEVNGETAEEALQALRAWVGEQIGTTRRDLEERDRAQQLRYQVAEYEQRLKDARAKWDKAEAFMKSHGIDTSAYGDLPF